MHSKILRALGIAAVMALASFSQSAFAAEDKITFSNEMDIGVKALYCAGVDDAGQQLLGPVAAGASAELEAAKVPGEDACARIYALMDNGAGWQFYPTTDLDGITQIVLAWDRPGDPAQAHAPCLLLGTEYEAIPTPAGLPLEAVRQMMQFGMQYDQWKNLATPGYDSLANPGEFSVSFAYISWSLAPNGITYYEEPVGDNLRIAEQIDLTAPYSSDSIGDVLEAIRQSGFRPLLLATEDIAVAFAEEGKKLVSNPALAERLETGDAAWDALNEEFQKTSATTAKTIIMMFGDEEMRLELRLKTSNSKAVLRLIRNEGAPLG